MHIDNNTYCAILTASEYTTQNMYQLRYEIVHAVTKLERSDRNGVDVVDISCQITREQSYFAVNTLKSIALLNCTHLKIVLLNSVTFLR